MLDFEKWRPQFHFTPPAHWMNDPNGLVWYEGNWHLFYQYYPEGTVWGPMHWGHAISPDLLKWTHAPIALYADTVGRIFSGSAIVDYDNLTGLRSGEKPPLIAFYTYDTATGQSQHLAFSNDAGLTWTPYAGNPVVPNPGIADFRDPKVFWHSESQHWIMCLAVHDCIRFFSSLNLLEWTFESDFYAHGFAANSVWECPDLFPLQIDDGIEQRWVLLVSMTQGAPAGGSGTCWFTGRFDGKSFVADYSEHIQWLDFGPDNYAGVTWSNVQDGRRILLSWMSNWNYARHTPTAIGDAGWRGAMIFPRALGLRLIDGKSVLVQRFAQEITARRKLEMQYGPTLLQHELILAKKDAAPVCRMLELQIRTEGTSAKSFILNLFSGAQKSLQLHWDCYTHMLSIDRSQAGFADFHPSFPLCARCHTAPRNGFLTLEILIDSCSIEVLVNNGEYSLTMLFFPLSISTGLSCTVNDGDVLLESVRLYQLM